VHEVIFFGLEPSHEAALAADARPLRRQSRAAGGLRPHAHRRRARRGRGRARRAGAAARTVVVYTALDQLYSEPILAAFAEQTGIDVLSVYDSEAAKTTGLVARLVAERDRPRCDVFWNNEIVRTIQLQHEGLLQPYAAPGAAHVPAAFKDPEGYWTGFAGRMRVVAFNTDRY